MRSTDADGAWDGRGLMDTPMIGTSRTTARRTATASTRATAPRAAGAASAPRATRADLARLDRALAELERAEGLLAHARRERDTDPRAAFELVHRAALRAAGVVIDQANRHRRRKLPLNAWVALSRCGGVHRRWAQEVEPMVAERRRLDADAAAMPDLDLLDLHCRTTAERIAGVRAEITMALLPGAGAVPTR